jgi:hypothetical protein
MSTLNDFIASVKTEGLMQTNRFDVVIPLPPILNDNSIYVGDVQKILLHCDSVVLPGINISTNGARTFGEMRDMPYEKTYEDIVLSFYVDNTMQVKLFFDTWANESVQSIVTRKFNYYQKYVTPRIYIHVNDRMENTKYTVRLFDAYPKSVGAIQLDTGSREIMKMTVVMNYRYWDSLIGQSDSQNLPFVDNELSAAGVPSADETSVPNSYFTKFSQYQSNYNSFENARNQLYATNGKLSGLGSIFS